eukprot:6977103-Pyramimonas_sp.AAC.1
MARVNRPFPSETNDPTEEWRSVPPERVARVCVAVGFGAANGPWRRETNSRLVFLCLGND